MKGIQDYEALINMGRKCERKEGPLYAIRLLYM